MWLCVCASVSVCACMFVHVFVCVCACTCACLCVCVHACMCVCVCVTDETPTNCQKFLNKGGMQLFVSCLHVSNHFHSSLDGWGWGWVTDEFLAL